MSAPRYAPAAHQAVPPEIRPSSLALVPLPARRPPPPVPAPGDGPPASWVLHTMGYVGLFIVLAGSFLDGWDRGASASLYVLGGMFVTLAGVAVLVHTLVRPTERKYRQLLLAVGALAATLYAVVPITRAAGEIRAGGQAAALQQVADEVVRFGRLREWGQGYASEHLVIDGYRRGSLPDVLTSDTDSLGRTVDAVLLAKGASREEFDALVDHLERAGVQMMVMAGGGVALRTDGYNDILFYLPPGRARRPAEPILGYADWGSTPLGGGWYQLTRDSGER
ncbi:hypothetical protein [Longimicrobium terrae]|uniref:Uncharacterized protein n=1 Tax=Longimicrobium terrae TaxID=1639882 RepID=A0A841GZX2_9BACT|nr:hypothetical protein [Longimicrobium terrae]MBB4636699.1 hypothetical protein [Longimicrobium terrae]MBB6071302.1 hypothetical protein [Longimicrobium terrae]NNC29346.1 hypothetical protein [Longimicrobium terrae]